MTRIILDTDLAMGAPGSEIDDGFAFALAHTEPGLQLGRGTTVNGTADVESATMRWVERADRLAGPAGPGWQGAAAPLTRPDRYRPAPEDARAQFGHRVAQAGYAAVKIVEHVLAHPG